MREGHLARTRTHTAQVRQHPALAETSLTKKNTQSRGLAVYGDIGIDFFIQTSFRPEPGQDAIVDQVHFEPGGSAANCAAVAANLGVLTTFIGFIGTDSFGKLVLDDLKNYGVSSEHLEMIQGSTGITTAIIDPGGERTFYSYRGVNASGELSRIPRDFFEHRQVLHISGYSFQETGSRNNALYLIEEAGRSGTPVSLDPSFWFSREYIRENPRLLSEVSIIFPSREEANLLSGFADPAIASGIIQEMGPRTVITTLGPEGCYIASEEICGELPAFTLSEVVDTTGAGDAFCGGFLAAQIMGLTILDSAKIGSAAAGMIVGQVGGHRGAPGTDEMCAFLEAHDEGALARRVREFSPTSP